MFRRIFQRQCSGVVALAVALAPVCAGADEFDGVAPLTVDQLAKVRAEQETLRHDIAEASKGDDTYDGIHAAKKAMRDSLQKALDDNGVDKAQYVKEVTHATPEQRAAINDRVQELHEKTKAEREEAAAKEAAAKEAPSAAKPAASPKASEAVEAGPEVIRGFKGDVAGGLPPSITIPPKVDANGDKTPEIILGYDPDHAPEAPSPEAPKP
jgi:hypothetical protein